ncbi:hypothetical protein BJF90_18605 [Pseudonocardia sp. CNS-004]|nr:hypothetical protein BJF90_18605 [Pseudonocardia sp. CNS-004]
MLGKAVSCLSGRTAVYRRELLLEIEDDFMNEKFWGIQSLSGDDKRLTTLILERGHLTYMQRTAEVWSTFPDRWRTFFRQRLRWARNTWRSDLRALSKPWVWRHPFLAYTMIDKGISSFTLLLGPVAMTFALVTQNWILAGVLLLWWQVSRAAKLAPHIRRRPSSFFFVLGYVVVSWLMAIIKITALVTIRKQAWLTREVAVENGEVVRTTETDHTHADDHHHDDHHDDHHDNVIPLRRQRHEHRHHQQTVDGADHRGRRDHARGPRAHGGHRRRHHPGHPRRGPAGRRGRAGQVITPDNAASARRSWESRGRPHRMAIVRDYRIDIVTDGRLTRQVGRAGGTVGITDLDRALPSSWLTVDGGTATLDATVVLVRNVSMRLAGSGGSVQTLQLAGGATAADAASIHTGGGTVDLEGITITSVDPDTGQPLPADAKGRPTIVASNGGRLDATDVTINDLGALSDGTPGTDDDGTSAVEFHTGSTGSLVRTTVARASTGVTLSHTDDVRLDQLTVADSAEDGLVLAGDEGTTMSGIRATGNGENGVLVSGESGGRPITGISTNANGAFGLAVVGESGTQVSGVDTTADEAGGLRISRSTNIAVNAYTATDQRMGVFTHVNSSGIVLDGVQTTGGARGLVVEKSTSALEAKNSTFSGARVAGVAVNGNNIALTGVYVADSRSAVRVDRGAHDIRLDALTVNGGRDGVVTAAGTSGSSSATSRSATSSTTACAPSPRTRASPARRSPVAAPAWTSRRAPRSPTRRSPHPAWGSAPARSSRCTPPASPSTRPSSASTAPRATRSRSSTPTCTPWSRCAV